MSSTTPISCCFKLQVITIKLWSLHIMMNLIFIRTFYVNSFLYPIQWRNDVTLLIQDIFCHAHIMKGEKLKGKMYRFWSTRWLYYVGYTIGLNTSRKFTSIKCFLLLFTFRDSGISGVTISERRGTLTYYIGRNLLLSSKVLALLFLGIVPHYL